MDALIQRMMRAAMLESALYDEVEADSEATSQALLVVVLASIASGIGIGLGGLILGRGPFGFVGGLIGGLVIALIGWIVWALITYWIGVNLFKGTTTVGEMLRCIGFANSPGVLRIFAFIPILGGLLSFAVAIWTLVAGVIAVRQALDFDTGKAIATVIIGWVVMVVVMLLLAIPLALLGLGGAMLFG